MRLNTSSPATGPITRPAALWMLVDLEPGYEPLELGDTIEPTTLWRFSRKESSLPEAMISHDVPARLERVVTAKGHNEWIAHLSDTFATVVPHWDRDEGPATLTGYLEWDRYLWLFHPTPQARARIIERANLTQATTLVPSSQPNTYTPHYHGPMTLSPAGKPPPGHHIQWHCARLNIHD